MDDYARAKLVQFMILAATPFIILLNILVYLLWVFLNSPHVESAYMTNNFLVSWSGLLDGRIWTLITSVFSHNMFWHLFMNMYVLSSFGPIIERTLGTRRFLKFYFTAGAIASISHATVSNLILGQPDIPAQGASGAISGIIILFSLLFPRQKILILGLIPTPAILGSLIFVGLDLWGLMAQAEGGGLPIGHGAHLGGALSGFLYYFLFLRRRQTAPKRLFE